MSAQIDAAAGDPYYTQSLPDQYEAAKMEPFNPAPQQEWWQSLVTLGVTRAIDNRYGPQNLAGNTQASYAGANGATYYANPQAGVGFGGIAGMSGGTLLLLAGAAVVAVLALKG